MRRISETCGLTTTGVAYCWGWNVYGGVVDGTTTGRVIPVAVYRPWGGRSAIAAPQFAVDARLSRKYNAVPTQFAPITSTLILSANATRLTTLTIGSTERIT